MSLLSFPFPSSSLHYHYHHQDHLFVVAFQVIMSKIEKFSSNKTMRMEEIEVQIFACNQLIPSYSPFIVLLLLVRISTWTSQKKIVRCWKLLTWPISNYFFFILSFSFLPLSIDYLISSTQVIMAFIQSCWISSSFCPPPSAFFFYLFSFYKLKFDYNSKSLFEWWAMLSLRLGNFSFSNLIHVL